MSASGSFVNQTDEGLEEFRISTVSNIEAPTFIPEIKGPEDLHVILRNLDGLEENNPIFVPGYRWESLWTKGEFSRYDKRMKELHSHPLIYYEPPELFRYRMPDVLKTYALRGSRSRARKFKQLVTDGEIEEAINLLPVFFQPFMEVQRESLLKKYGCEIPRGIKNTDRKITEAWRDSRADNGYEDYFKAIAKDAKDTRNAHVVPPVPPILSSSDQNVVRRMRGSNRAMAEICETANLGFGNPVHSYYHVYLDYGILKNDNDLDDVIIEGLQNDLSAQSYAGTVLSMTGYEKVWGNNLEVRLEEFVQNVSDISRRHQMPLLLPRSGWYGLHLTDFGVHGFGSLLNGNERYSRRGGGMPKDKPYLKYGKIPLYGEATEIDLSELEDYLKKHNGQVTKIGELPHQPPEYTSNGRSYKDRFGSDRDFRIEFSKARRLIHAEEARELRGDLKSGVPNPARRYLERSEHSVLS